MEELRCEAAEMEMDKYVVEKIDFLGATGTSTSKARTYSQKEKDRCQKARTVATLVDGLPLSSQSRRRMQQCFSMSVLTYGWLERIPTNADAISWRRMKANACNPHMAKILYGGGLDGRTVVLARQTALLQRCFNSGSLDHNQSKPGMLQHTVATALKHNGWTRTNEWKWEMKKSVKWSPSIRES